MVIIYSSHRSFTRYLAIARRLVLPLWLHRGTSLTQLIRLIPEQLAFNDTALHTIANMLLSGIVTPQMELYRAGFEIRVRASFFEGRCPNLSPKTTDILLWV